MLAIKLGVQIGSFYISYNPIHCSMAEPERSGSIPLGILTLVISHSHLV